MFLLSLILSLATVAMADTPSTHGMVVIGSAETYLSHLPMFHPPHAYQVILKVDLGQTAKAALAESRARNPTESLFTLLPEKFDLPAMVAKPRPFKATLYQGHFERGGKAITGEITVRILQTVYFSPLLADAPKPLSLTYLYFGNSHEQFLAHAIAGRPDFDQLLEVEAHWNPPAQTLAITFKKEEGPLKPGVFVAEADGYSPLQVKVKASPYLEFQDLSH